jgi:hypothetical protein
LSRCSVNPSSHPTGFRPIPLGILHSFFCRDTGMYKYTRVSVACHIRLHPHPVLVPLCASKATTAVLRRSPYGWHSLRSLHSVSTSSEVSGKSRGRNLCRSRDFTPTSTSTNSEPSFLSPLYKSQPRPFSSTPIAMTATKIDGTAIAKSIRERLQSEIQATQKINPRYKPSLKIIQGNSRATSALQWHANVVSRSW